MGSCFVGSYFQHERRHKTVLWDSCHTAACRYTWWTYKSVVKNKKKTGCTEWSALVSALDSGRTAAKMIRPLGGTAAPFSCGSTGIPPLPHICWDPPTLRPASPPDTATLCGGDNNKQAPSSARQKSTTDQTIIGRKRTRRTPVFVLVRAAPPVFAVVVIWTGVSLTTQAGGLFTELRLVVGQHIIAI